MNPVDLSLMAYVDTAVDALAAGDGDAFDTAMDTLRDLPGAGRWESAAATCVLAASFMLASVPGDDREAQVITWAYTTFLAVNERALYATLTGLETGNMAGVDSLEELVLTCIIVLGWLRTVSPIGTAALQAAVGDDLHIVRTT